MDDATKALVRQRSGGVCEYCHLPEPVRERLVARGRGNIIVKWYP
jgi:hypothetical protein